MTNYVICFGVWYNGVLGPVKSDAVALLGGYRYVVSENMSVKFTYSYDMQLNGAHKRDGGIHEISLIMEFSSLHLFRGAGNSYRSLAKAKNNDSQLAYSGF